MRREAVRKILLVLVGAVFLFSTAMVVNHRLQMRSSAAYTESVIQMAVVPAPERTDAETPEPTAGETEVAAPIQVDFDALRAENPDVIGWLYCPDTPINYPVVQGTDNAFYLHRRLDGSKNSAGTLFMDYRNADDGSEWNSVIYGHNMNNGSMFGTLTDYEAQAYFDAHPELYWLTPERNYVIQLAAGFTTAADAELYTAFCPEEAERAHMIETWLADSDFVSGIVPEPRDQLVTCSTCAYDYQNARYVLIGVLKELGKAD